jgi:hypothetical protein
MSGGNLAAVDIDHHIIPLLAIRLARRDGYLIGITNIHTHDRFLKSGDQLALTNGEFERLALPGGVKTVPSAMVPV